MAGVVAEDGTLIRTKPFEAGQNDLCASTLVYVAHGDGLPRTRGRVEAWGSGTFAVLDLLWFVVLLWILLARRSGWLGIDEIPDPAGGLVWFVVPWAGALGGVTISAVGVCKFGSDWDPRWNYWHLFRPVMGAIFGVFGVLVLTLIVGTIGGFGTDKTNDWTQLSPTAIGMLAVIAFVGGYRESTARQLMKKIWDTIFAPETGKDEDVETTALTVSPVTLNFGKIVVGQSAVRTVRLRNGTAEAVKISDASTPAGSPYAILGDQGTNIWAGSKRDIGIRFTPTSPGSYSGQAAFVFESGGTSVVVLRGVGVTP